MQAFILDLQPKSRTQNPVSRPAKVALTVGGALVVTGLGIWWWSRSAHAATPKPLPDDDDVIDTTATPTPTPSGKYVGAGWTDWPHKGVFPNEAAFVRVLDEMGYSTRPGSMRSAANKDAVSAFQDDWNAANDYLVSQRKTPMSPRRLVVDNKLGSNTVNALYQAYSRIPQLLMVTDWDDLLRDVANWESQGRPLPQQSTPSGGGNGGGWGNILPWS